MWTIPSGKIISSTFALENKNAGSVVIVPYVPNVAFSIPSHSENGPYDLSCGTGPNESGIIMFFKLSQSRKTNAPQAVH